jgi:hypothetical protein
MFFQDYCVTVNSCDEATFDTNLPVKLMSSKGASRAADENDLARSWNRSAATKLLRVFSPKDYEFC